MSSVIPLVQSPSSTRTTAYRMAERPRIRRQRSQTVPSISNVLLKSSSTTSSSDQARLKHVPVRQTRSLEFTTPTQVKPRSYGRPGSSCAQHRVSFSGNSYVGMTYEAKKVTQGVIGNRSSLSKVLHVSADQLPPHKTSKEELPIGTRNTKSKSIPADNDKSSIYSIVKARSLGLKWYRGNNNKTAITKQKRKKSEPLPTIHDKQTISLCEAKCSPQFAEAMSLLQSDNQNVQDIKRELNVLCLK